MQEQGNLILPPRRPRPTVPNRANAPTTGIVEVYHGTNAEFNPARPRAVASKHSGKGFWVTLHHEVAADMYANAPGGRVLVYELDLNAEDSYQKDGDHYRVFRPERALRFVKELRGGSGADYSALTKQAAAASAPKRRAGEARRDPNAGMRQGGAGTPNVTIRRR